MTGGLTSMNRVSRYNADGWVEDIGDLMFGRNVHGCLQFTNTLGTKVTSY